MRAMRRIALPATTLLLLGYLACGGGDKDTGGSTHTKETLPAGYPDCPQDSVIIVVGQIDSIALDDSNQIGTRLITDIPLATTTDNLPEFHDCQRLIDGRTYGPLVGIWASDRLEQLPALLDSVHTEKGSQTFGVAVAEMFNFNLASYPTLAIQRGFSCLYLNGNSENWEARMVWARTDEKRCLEPFDFTSSEGQELRAVPLTLPPGISDNDIPPVARWDWDTVSNHNYIGVKCGSQWCEIGDPHFASSAKYSRVDPSAGPHGNLIRSMTREMEKIASFAPLSPHLVDRVLEVKGWYDEQHLAIRNSTGQLMSTAFIGTAFPHPALDGIANVGSFEKWVPAAYVVVERDYPGKLHLRPGLNEISICQGNEPNSCDEAVPLAPLNCPVEEKTGSRRWYARVQLPGEQPEYHCIVRRTHGGLVIPRGTVRWHWSENDETLWVRCEAGCCTTH